VAQRDLDRERTGQLLRVDRHGRPKGRVVRAFRAPRRRVGEAQPRQLRSVDPTLEVGREVEVRRLFEAFAEVAGARLGEPVRLLEALQAAREGVRPRDPAEHVQHAGALVVHHGAEETRVALEMSEPMAEDHRPGAVHTQRPLSHVVHHLAERRLAP